MEMLKSAILVIVLFAGCVYSQGKKQFVARFATTQFHWIS